MPRSDIRSNTKFILERISKQNKAKFAAFPFLTFVYVAAFLCAITIISVLVLGRRLPPEVPLYYGLPEGEDQIVLQVQLIIPSVLALIILIVNSITAFFLKNEFLQQTLVLAGLVAAFFSTITTIKIILLVGSF